MIIRSLTVENFRQFYGPQSLQFSDDPQRNVTLIYGSNGSGKTTLLNAFTWGLYGSTTAGFDQSEWLINNLAWHEAKPDEEVVARVQIEFEDDGKLYAVDRAQSARKRDDGPPTITRDGRQASLHVTDESGKNEELHAVRGAINAILPERLHRFVFFDGERGLERLTQPESYRDAEDAVKTVLGLEVVERAIEDLGAARRELTKELSEVGTDRDKELNTQIERMEEQEGKLEGELEVEKSNLAANRRELVKVNDELAKQEATRELQKRRAEFDQAVDQAEERIRGANKDLDEAVRRDGYLAFVEPLADRALALFEQRRARGEIPAAIKLQFVQDLLTKGECICGSPLREGEPEHEHVSGWLAKAARPEVEDGWIDLTAEAKSHYRSRDELYRHLRGTLAEREGHERERKIWDDKRSEIGIEIKGLDLSEVQALEDRRTRLSTDIGSGERRIGALEQDLGHLRNEVAARQRDLEEAEKENAKATLARRRVTAAGMAIEVFKQILGIRTEQTRRELDARIKKVFADICFRPFVPALGEGFRLTLSETIGGSELAVARSTGESQILSLSFVGAVAERARERYEESRGDGASSRFLSFEGGIFPLVLDAVFGNLDDEYQEAAAQALPDLAPQVIIMVSRAQGQEAVRKALWPRAGSVYVCTMYTSEKGKGSTTVQTPSGDIDYRVEIDEARDRTELVRA